MFISDSDSEEIKPEVSKILKTLGIKHRFKKFDDKLVPNERKEDSLLFKTKLEKLKKIKIKLPQCTSLIEVPAFLLHACSFIEENIAVEGLFRKAGSSSRQKELKAKLDGGAVLDTDSSYHVIDVANVLKLFLRELPEPLIPFKFHDMFLRCLALKEKNVDALLLTCLLLPIEYLYSLTFLMNFLNKVALNCDMNKMDVGNLAIIMTPNIMPVTAPKITPRGTLRINHHVQVVKILIENAALIGVVPDCICEQLCLWHPSSSISSHDELDSSQYYKKKKKRRSGSLTRMLNGLKKMVGAKGSPEETNAITSTPDQSAVLHTPCIKSTAKKRKASDASHIAPLSAKKKKDVMRLLPHGSILADSYAPTHLTPRIVVAQQISRKSKSPAQKSKSKLNIMKHSSDSGLCRARKTISVSRLRISRLSIGGRKNKKKIERDDSGLESSLAATPDSLDMLDERMNLSDDYVRISKKEYEAIETRVSEIESKLSQEFQNIRGVSISDVEDTPSTSKIEIKNIQSEYEKTLEESGKLNNSCTEELARRLSRDLKIRRSVDSCIIRSPSARKIGTMRRRSKDNSPLHSGNLSLNTSDRPKFKSINFYPSKSLRRGRPNTVYTGLPQPSPLFPSNDILNSHLHLMKGAGLSNNNNYDHEITIAQSTSLETNDFDFNFGVLTRSQALKRSSFQEHDKNVVIQSPLRKTQSFNYVNDSVPSPSRNIEWENAENYLSRNSEKESKFIITGRPSIAKIRSQNAGMVLAKAKLFDSVADNEKHNQLESKPHTETVNSKYIDSEEKKSAGKVKDNKKTRTYNKSKDISSQITYKTPPKKSLLKKVESNKSPISYINSQKENTYPNLELKCKPTSKNSTFTNYCKAVVLPDGLKETIYDICTPLSEKQTSLQPVSPLKDLNRDKIPPKSQRMVNMTPPIKKHLITSRSSHLSPFASIESKVRRRPMKAVVQASTPRRSPRQLILKSRLGKP